MTSTTRNTLFMFVTTTALSTSAAIALPYERIEYENLAMGDFKATGYELTNGSASSDLDIEGEYLKILESFSKRLVENSKGLSPEIQKLINDRFWDML